MKRKYFLVLWSLMILIASACSSEKSAIVGQWKVEWVTDPAGYPGVDPNTDFTMNGKFDFDDDGRVTISAFGHQNCIFGTDTLIHSLNWQLEGDTLRLVNDNDVHGMVYTVLNMDEENMKLRLMEDIFLNFERN